MFYKVSGVPSTCQKPDWIKEYQVLRSDNRGEFMSNPFASFLKDHGVQHQPSIPYNPQQNSMAERLNQTIVESVRCMLHHGQMNVRIRQKQSIQLQNRSPHKALVNRTPEKTWSRRKPTMKDLRVFGCLVYVLKPSETYSKLEPKNKKFAFVGYNIDSKAY
jgi:hypothetical protein